MADLLGIGRRQEDKERREWQDLKMGIIPNVDEKSLSQITPRGGGVKTSQELIRTAFKQSGRQKYHFETDKLLGFEHYKKAAREIKEGERYLASKNTQNIMGWRRKSAKTHDKPSKQDGDYP